MHHSWKLTSIILILLVGAAVRFHQLGAQSLWHDEGNAYVQATRSVSAIADNAARDIHPPGYYWLLAIWRVLIGESEFALRALSAFASLISVALTYALGRQLSGSVAALIAALSVALNTFSIFYAQEARMYALLALWSVAAMWAFVLLLKRNQRTWLIALALFNAAGLWTHYAFPFMMLTQGALVMGWLLIPLADARKKRPTLQMYILANILTILMFLPWLPTAFDQIIHWPSTGGGVALSEALSTILGYLTYGITIDGGISTAAAFFLLFGLLHDRQRKVQRGILPMGWRILLPVIWGVVPVGLFLGFGLYREANLKFLLSSQIAVALWLGRGVQMLWQVEVRRETQILKQLPKFAAGLGVVVMVNGLWQGVVLLYHDAAYQRDDYRAIVAAITTSAQPDDAIILSAPNQQEVFDYYYNGENRVYPLPRGLGGDDTASLTEVRQVIKQHPRLFAVLWGTDERDPNDIIENTLDSEAYEASSEWYGDVRLVHYVAPVAFDRLTDVDVQFGEHINLLRYGLSAQTMQPGDVLQLTLEWTTESRVDQNYKVFVQLLDEKGALMAQRDAEPGGGQRPTISWQTGETIHDNHALIMPNDLPAANYTLIIGLYNADDPNERLNVDVAEEDYLLLKTITLEGKS